MTRYVTFEVTDPDDALTIIDNVLIAAHNDTVVYVPTHAIYTDNVDATEPLNDDDVVDVEADPTPPHGTPRPPTKPRRKRPLVTSVPCDYCQAPAGSRCVSANGNRWDAYDYGHATRIRDRDRAWKATQTS